VFHPLDLPVLVTTALVLKNLQSEQIKVENQDQRDEKVSKTVTNQFSSLVLLHPFLFWVSWLACSSPLLQTVKQGA
jgi:hypothetical protein